VFIITPVLKEYKSPRVLSARYSVLRLWFIRCIYHWKITRQINEGAINNEQIREIGNSGYTTHRTKKNKKLKDVQHWPYQKSGVNPGDREGQAVIASYKTTVLLLIYYAIRIQAQIRDEPSIQRTGGKDRTSIVLWRYRSGHYNTELRT
jgi:hypothetical protein